MPKIRNMLLLFKVNVIFFRLWNMITEHASEAVRDFLQDSFPYDYEFLNQNAAFMGVAPEPKLSRST